jgi:hypothetical protein
VSSSPNFLFLRLFQRICRSLWDSSHNVASGYLGLEYVSPVGLQMCPLPAESFGLRFIVMISGFVTGFLICGFLLNLTCNLVNSTL